MFPPMELTAIVEALVFASPQSVSSQTLVRCIRRGLENQGGRRNGDADAELRVTVKTVEDAVNQLNEQYEREGRSFRLAAEAGGWRFLSQPDFAPWIEELLPEQKPPALSPAALETLSIIAYRQPITRSSMETIRGVGVDGVLQTLVDRDLVRSVGRANVPGRPMLYGTSEQFLTHFGINRIEDLPNGEELRFASLPSEADASESAGREEQLELETASAEGNGGGSSADRLSPVAAARKLAESERPPSNSEKP